MRRIIIDNQNSGICRHFPTLSRTSMSNLRTFIREPRGCRPLICLSGRQAAALSIEVKSSTMQSPFPDACGSAMTLRSLSISHRRSKMPQPLSHRLAVGRRNLNRKLLLYIASVEAICIPISQNIQGNLFKEERVSRLVAQQLRNSYRRRFKPPTGACRASNSAPGFGRELAHPHQIE
jgi:hypothetical protein